MTDEEIEKALEERAYSKERADNGDGYWLALKDSLSWDAFNYIKRLKNEIAGLTGVVEALKTDNENLTRTLEEANEELKTVRKEIAKEILQELNSRLWDCIDTASDIGGREHNQTVSSLINFIKQNYSVEVKK